MPSSAASTGPRVLAVDIGSSSVKAVVVDAGARPVGPVVRTAHPPSPGPPGTFAPGALLATLTAVLDRVGDVRVDGVGMSCFWHSLIGVDASGEPVTDVLTWALPDSRAAASRLAAELDPAAVHRRTGAKLHPSHWPAKLRWLAEDRPHDFRRARWWVDTSDWLLHRLFGGPPATSVSMASGTGLLDLRTCAWDSVLLEALGVDADRLPQLQRGARAGLLAEPAARWPSLADVPWWPVVGDGAAGNLGAGAFGRDRMAVNVGTSAAVRIAWSDDAPDVPGDLWCYRVDERRVVAGGAVSNGGNVRAWLTEILRLPADADAQVSARRADATDVAVVPLLAAERTPGPGTPTSAAITGLTLGTDAVDVLRAGMQAVAASLRPLLAAVRAWEPEAGTVIGTGGGLRQSPAWRQILADAFDLPVLPSAEPEASARGAALLALEHLGTAVDLRGGAVGPVVRPEPAGVAAMTAVAHRQQRLAAALRP